MNTSASRVLRLEANQVGRDFVIGDIHGAYDLVLEAMRKVEFNKTCDRLFSVGDLIDRGPDSHRCLKFLQQPYVYAIRGNHEQMLIDMHADGEPHEAVVEWMSARNGFGWWKTTPQTTRDQILDAVKALPLAIEIQTLRGTVGLIHAEIPPGMSWPTFLSRIERGDEKVIETCLEGRDRYRARDEGGVPGVGRVFVGHTVHWGGATRYGNVYAIDTGAVFGHLGIKDKGSLTMAKLAVSTGILSAPPPREVSLVDIRIAEDGEAETRPFGQYAKPL